MSDVFEGRTCRKCSIQLSADVCSPSSARRKQWICRTCSARQRDPEKHREWSRIAIARMRGRDVESAAVRADKRAAKIARDARILELLKAKMPFVQIAKEVGCKRQVVDRVRAKNGGAAVFPPIRWRDNGPRKKRAARPRPESPTPVVHIPPPADAKTLESLGARDCRYAYGTGPYVFCGRDTGDVLQSWCPGHKAVVWDQRRTLESMEKSQMRDHRVEAA